MTAAFTSVRAGLIATAASSLGLALVACGGGGGSGPTATAERQLLPFVTAANELKTFNPLKPSAEAQSVDSSVGATVAVLGGRYRPDDHGVDDPHYPLMLYIKQGQVFRLDLLPTASQVPVRVSSISDACQIARVFPDFANPEDSRVLIIRQGSDLNCNTPADNNAGFVRLSADDATDPTPLTADELPSLAFYAADGSLHGMLARVGPATGGGVLTRYDADLQDGIPIADLEPGTPVDFGGPRPSATLAYLRLKTAGAESTCLYRYADSGLALGDCLHVFSGALRGLAQTSQADTLHTYLADGNQVLRIEHSGAPEESLYSGSTAYVATALQLSSRRILINYADSGGSQTRYGIDSIARSGGEPIALRSGATRAFTLHAVAGNRLYFSDELIAEATAILDDGSGSRVLPGTRWGGFTKSQLGISIGSSTAFDDAYHGTFSQAKTSTSSSLISFNARTSAGLAALGTTDGQVLSATCGGFGRYRLSALKVFRSNGPGTGSTIDVDVYFADTLAEGSLRPVAATVGGSDRTVF